jgi:arylformamidase
MHLDSRRVGRRCSRLSLLLMVFVCVGLACAQEPPQRHLWRARALGAGDSTTSPPAMRKFLDVRYATVPGVNPNLVSLDVYAPPGGQKHPVMVMIHGGAWRGGDKAYSACGLDKARFFVTLGYAYVSINYRLSPEIQHPVHVQDVAKALSFVHDHIAGYGGDPERIFVMGHSAGAHLAALVATDESCLAAEGRRLSMLSGVILLDGAGYDIASLQAMNSVGPVLRRIYQVAFGKDPAKWKSASPVTHVAPNKGIPPFLIFHAGSRVESGLESRALAQSLRDAGVAVKVVAVPGKNHGQINADVGKPGDILTTNILEFLKPPR